MKAGFPSPVLVELVRVIRFALHVTMDNPDDTETGVRSGKPPPSLESIIAKVNRAVTVREINYTVLLDPTSSVGGQYNGGELPTTVIFDKEGRVRRRFTGERNVSVFEAMVAEAANPAMVPGK